MINDFGESKVTIEKNNLLSAIRANREKHVKEFEETHAGYRVALVEELTKKLAEAKEGKRVGQHIEAAEPASHVKDYDRVIRMIEMSTAAEIIITEQQFSQYVLDEWGWQAAFKAMSARYSGTR